MVDKHEQFNVHWSELYTLLVTIGPATVASEFDLCIKVSPHLMTEASQILVRGWHWIVLRLTVCTQLVLQYDKTRAGASAVVLRSFPVSFFLSRETRSGSIL